MFLSFLHSSNSSTLRREAFCALPPIVIVRCSMAPLRATPSARSRLVGGNEAGNIVDVPHFTGGFARRPI